MTDDALRHHYDELGRANRYKAHYERWFGDAARRDAETIAALVESGLRVTSLKGLAIADVGGGTGETVRHLKERDPANQPICHLVEPFDGMIEVARSQEWAADHFVHATAEEFAAVTDVELDAVIAKEMIHHIADQQSFFRNLRTRLRARGVIVIMTRPHHPTLPFGPGAIREWMKVTRTDEQISRSLRDEGYDVQIMTRDYPIRLSLADWLASIGDETIFSNVGVLSREERALDLEQVRQRFSSHDEIEFVDRLVFIVGQREAG